MGCCQEKTPNLPSYCHSDADCTDGKHCTVTISGLDQCCRGPAPEPSACFYDSECHGDRICSYPHCFPSKYDPSLGMGVCMAPKPDQVCSSDTDCTDGKHCELLRQN